jgi:tetratricopeptide (TPR) repeat protein
MKIRLTFYIILFWGLQISKASTYFFEIIPSDTLSILKKLNKEIDSDSTNATAYFERGNIFIAQKKYKEALFDFDKAIKLKPDYAEAFHKRAWAKYYLQHFDGVSFFDDFGTAIKLKPNFAEAYFDRGVLMNIYDSNVKPTRGCSDICKAYELGYPKQKGLFADNCNCKK